MPERTTIVDVAARAGVSKGLVSLALNRRPGVSEPTRQRILAAAEDLGWTPSAPARALSTARARALGLVLAREPAVLAADPFFPAFISGIETALSDSGYTLTLAVVRSAARERAAYRRLAGEGRVDGVILSDLRTRDPRPRLVAELGLPAVTLGRPLGVPAPASVSIDDGPGIRAAVEHLVALGHRRIAHVAGPATMLHGLHRRREVERAAAEAGLPPTEVIVTDFSAADGARATAERLERADPPTAIVYANDPMAIAGIGLAQSRGLVVPRDLSVTGFDDSEIGRHLHPRLTTVATDAVGWGAAAARALLAAIDGAPVSDLRLAPARLVVRASTAPPLPAPVRRRTP